MTVRVVDLFLWVAVGINISGAVLSWRAHKRYRRALAAFKLESLPDNVVANIRQQLMQMVGADIDLFTRIETDMNFMHEQLCKVHQTSSDHQCPVCQSTLPEIRSVLERLHTVNVNVNLSQEKSGD